MVLNFFGRVAMFAFVALVFVSCAKRTVLTDASLGAQAIHDYAMKNTPELCAYKGRIAVTVDGGNGKFSFSALLDKKCSGDFKLTVLGALNRPMFELSSSGGNISADASDDEMKKSLLSVGQDYAAIISMLLRSPLKLPDTTFTLNTSDSAYELIYGNGTKVIINNNFFITGYIYNNASNIYEWKERSIASITAAGGGQSLALRFLNTDGWQK